MVRCTLVLSIALLFLSNKASFAVEIPHYDSSAECTRAVTLPNCIEAEHASLSALHFWWQRVDDDAMKKFCIAAANTTPQMRYTRLMRCLAWKARLPPPSLAGWPVEKPVT